MTVTHFSEFPDDDENFDKMREVFGPGQTDQMIRQAMQFCWIGLPEERRNPDELEKQFRRTVDRALVNFREDYDEFQSG